MSLTLYTFLNMISSYWYLGGARMYKKYRTPYILSCNRYRSFWVSWKDGNIEVGKGNVYTETFMTWVPPNPHRIQAISLNSYQEDMDWIVDRPVGMSLFKYCMYRNILGFHLRIRLKTGSFYLN